MFGKLLKKLGLGAVEAKVADTVLTRVADAATHGAASKVEDAVQAASGEVRRRKHGDK